MFGFFGDDDRELTYKVFEHHGVDKAKADMLLAEGYYLRGGGSLQPSVDDAFICDSFYGSGLMAALHPLDDFLSGNIRNVAAREVRISSTEELLAFLNAPQQARMRDQLCFRGQGREHVTQRGYPNPALAIDGKERLVIPSIWRQFRDDWSARFRFRGFESIFSSLLGDDLVYYGIDDYRTLGERNAERYGPHTMSDLEDFPDAESQEYHRRWYDTKITGHWNPELAVIEQHYGMDTEGLDVTFDPLMAEFFATNRYVALPGNHARYDAINRGEHEGVIYCMKFSWPTLKRSNDMIQGISLFDHIPPTRPLRQSCALPFFHSHDFNNAACHLHCVLRLDVDYRVKAPMAPSAVFPSVDEDPFYKAALEVKGRYGSSHPFAKFVEYDLD